MYGLGFRDSGLKVVGVWRMDLGSAEPKPLVPKWFRGLGFRRITGLWFRI